ncbi:MAG TPA: 4-hydroxy-3-methylbut-2-enyl diphosphate reductase [Deltaproteobacteria bacterium]|nr:MAG: 4-hydroxy-3-methylbut-2-enyl diphosphate reductase [Deltaproteobacteria bacterium GWA2_45_12]HBF12775.1 4-hydroxy-3-methylbut-2-enyl diphosphate reductase [Deltaproteobacteria bacterium]
MTVNESILDFKMNRKGFGLKDDIKTDLDRYYKSQLVEEIKAAGYSKTYGPLTIHLAKEFGFCYGVDRAVELAYETRKRYPDKRVFLTTEIIHNPLVNTDLQKMGIRFLAGQYKDADFDEIKENDVVIVPAFGTTVNMLSKLMDKKCELIDTICASVIVVWKRIEKYAKNGFTVVVHGKHYHEETQATTSRVSVFPDGKYIVVFNEKEAQEICDYIVKGENKETFIEKFREVMSPGFDPDRDFIKIGLANQTTMLSSESLQIANMIKQALIKRYGETALNEHYMSFDTICNATQDRQDAIVKLKEKNPDFILVLGGYNSSNTNHLCEMAEKIAPTYHIDRTECLVSSTLIRHKPFGKKTEIETRQWLKNGALSVGITAGASTPNIEISRVVEKLLSFVQA